MESNTIRCRINAAVNPEAQNTKNGSPCCADIGVGWFRCTPGIFLAPPADHIDGWLALGCCALLDSDGKSLSIEKLAITLNPTVRHKRSGTLA